jgi:hypothetical protein
MEARGWSEERERENINLEPRGELEPETNSSKSVASDLIENGVLMFHLEVAHDVKILDDVSCRHHTSRKSRVECLWKRR